MRDVTHDNFGLLIAYLVPGAIVLLGFRPFSPELQAWFASTPANAPTLSGFLFLTVASLATGMVVSALRWAILDTIHGWMGVRPPPLNFARLGQNVEGLRLLIEIHYRHHLFYGNSGIALLVAYTCYRVTAGLGELGWIDAAIIPLEVVLFLASRDTLSKYHRRSQQLLPPTFGRRRG